MSYEPLAIIPFQNGVNNSAAPLSPASMATLSDGSWNAICSSDSYIRPWSGATTQGANTGARKLLPFGSTWGGIRDIGYSDNSFLTSTISGSQVTTATPHGYITGLPITTSGAPAPTGLPSGTYYAIVTGASTLRFASTLANALLGTAIAISSAGAATITLDVSNATVTASGNFFQDIGLSRWGIGAGQPMIAGVSVPGFQLSTNLQVQIATAGVYGAAIQAGLSQPSAPDIGIINTPGLISNSISAKLERSRPSTGAISVASPMSAVVQPQANKIYLVFPEAQSGQTHWRAFFTFQGFGGVGVAYLGSYLGLTDIPESVVAAGVAGGGSTASGTVTIGTNPADGDTLTVGGTAFTFKTVVTIPASQILIGADTTATATNTVAKLTTYAPATALYTSSANVITVTYSAPGATGNTFTLASSVSPGTIQLSGATLTGGVSGIARSLEFNFQDGDLIPIEASFDDYAPPAGTHAIRLNTVMNIVGCYADSTSGPTTLNPGTCIAVSKENNYESYVPTSLLYLSEQVVDVLARPIDDFGYIGCQNSVSAIQYVGNRGDDLPSCTITTILPDIGVQYPHNWCTFRGQLLIYTAQGNLMLMDQQGNFDTTFANPVTKWLKSFTTAATQVGYDPKNDSIVVMNNKMMLVYSLQAGQWRQIWLPDYSLTGTTLSCVAAARNLYFTLSDSGVNTAYTYDTGAATGSLSFVCNYQTSGGSAVQDIYEMAVAARTDTSTYLTVCLNTSLLQTVFRQVVTTATSTTITSPEGAFTPNMTGKSFALFGRDIGGLSVPVLTGTITFVDADTLTLSVPSQATLTDCLLFIGRYVAVRIINANEWPANFFPNIPEARAIQVAVWLQGVSTGNVVECVLNGTSYASSRVLAV